MSDIFCIYFQLFGIQTIYLSNVNVLKQFGSSYLSKHLFKQSTELSKQYMLTELLCMLWFKNAVVPFTVRLLTVPLMLYL